MARKKENERVTYRELRNTPGRVWERLAADQPLTLMAEGEAKAILIPVADGDVAGAYEAYERGRALMALRSIQDDARRRGRDRMSLADINKAINNVRRERHAAERD
jgi:hypothetical protein